MKVPHEIRTQRLVLRRHRDEDLDGFARFLADDEAMRFIPFAPVQRTRAGAKQIFDYVIESYDGEAPIFSLTIADPKSDAYFGTCGVQPLPDDGGLEVFFMVLPEFQGRGIASEALSAVADYVFSQDRKARLVAFIVPENAASLRVAKNLGFVDAGPITREIVPGEVERGALAGRRYVLERKRRRR